MKFAVLSSGSRANCTYVEHDGAAVLIDCGLSATQAQKRMQSLGLDAARIKAVLVTHEHRDHVHGAGVFSRRFKVPVYASRATADFVEGAYVLEKFRSGECFDVEGFEVQSFPVPHDAVEPVGFVLRNGSVRLGHVTDLGHVSDPVRLALRGCHALLMEANHDEDLLLACDYPWILKRRIQSRNGHLSNEAAGKLIAEIADDLSQVVLGHISENSNTPAVARESVCRYLEQRLSRTLICASAWAPSPIITVTERRDRLAVAC